MPAAEHALPTQQQLLFPLLAEVVRNGGRMRAGEACDAVADRLGLPTDVRNVRQVYRLADGRLRQCNTLDRRIRWVRQNAIAAGLLTSAGRGIWATTERGHKAATISEPGVVVAVAVSDLGTILWADAISAMSVIERGSIQLGFTSPPYPLVRQRSYDGDCGEWAADTYLETLVRHADRVKPLLTLDGSLVLNLGDVYQQGAAVLEPYQEQLAVEMIRRGWHLCGKTVWFNPAAGKRTPWVTKKRSRLASGYEVFWHWSPVRDPYADNRAVLQPYSAEFRSTLAAGGERRRPSSAGSRMSSPGLRYRTDNGGSIPFNVIRAANTANRGAYRDYCFSHGLPLHPAPMPTQLADFFVRFASRPGDTVFDPFAGSLTTAEACERHGRQYIASDRNIAFLQGGLFKIRHAQGLAYAID